MLNGKHFVIPSVNAAVKCPGQCAESGTASCGHINTQTSGGSFMYLLAVPWFSNQQTALESKVWYFSFD